MSRTPWWKNPVLFTPNTSAGCAVFESFLAAIGTACPFAFAVLGFVRGWFPRLSALLGWGASGAYAFLVVDLLLGATIIGTTMAARRSRIHRAASVSNGMFILQASFIVTESDVFDPERFWAIFWAGSLMALVSIAMGVWSAIDARREELGERGETATELMLQ